MSDRERAAVRALRFTSPVTISKRMDDTDTKPAPTEETVLQQPAQGDEVGGPKGPEPTRYGDWEHKGRCIDF